MECRKCLTENPATNKFCGECGYELPEDPNLKDIALETEGERKQATVLFSDLSGYTAMTEKLDPEEVKTTLGRIFVEASKVVEKYEGTVERFFGDEIMALFGVPLAHEDDPVRAIHAASEIHDLVAAMSTDFEKRNGIKLAMHTGINTGLMVTGDKHIGKSRYGLTGDTVNVAKKLTGNAKSGEILVGPRTYQRSEGFFLFDALGSTSIKGKQTRIRTYKILGHRKYIEKPRIGVEHQVYSEMVGRDEELETMNRQLIKMIEGNGSVVNVIGEAGIGKSRLLTEFKNLETCKRVVLLKGKAISIGRNLAFHPIIDLLKHWAQIAEDDSEASALYKLESAIRNVCEDEAGGILPFVAILVGMKLSGKYADRIKDIEGEALDKMILKNIRDLLIRASKRRPLVIVIEDLHWADGSSIELLKSLFRLADTQRILFINIFRPGHGFSGEKVLEALQGHPTIEHVEIWLEPLAEILSEELIDNMLRTKGAPHTVARQIAKRAGGNPFFIEEIILSFIDEGVLVFKNGRFGMSNKAGAMEVPHTIQDVLNARIDRLEEETRNMVKIASVIGKNFFYKILANVATAIEDIDNRLSYLKKIQMILERMRLGELEFFFKHALLQEAAYKSILHDKRKVLHLRVAKTIESLFKERLHEFYGMLALHYNRGQDYEKAEYYLTKAGEEALKSSASKEALHYYQEALNLFLKEADGPADSEKQAMFEKNIALALYYRGRYDEAVDYFDKALNFYWGKQPGNAFSMAYRFSWAFFHILISLYCPFLKFGKTATREDIRNLELFYNKSKALAIINPQRFFIESIYICREVTRYKLSNFELGLKIYVASSSLFSFTGISFRLSRKILDSARERIQKDQVKTYIIFDFMETIQNYLIGHWAKIGHHDPELVNKNLEDGELYLSSQHLYWHGGPSIYMGDFDQAQDILEKLTDIAVVYENDFSILLNYMLKIKLLIERRYLYDALTEIEKGIVFAKNKGFTITLLDFSSCRAMIYTLLQDADQAARNIQLADEIRSEVRATPIQLSIFYRSQLGFSLFQLEEAIKSGDTAGAAGHITIAGRACKMIIKATRKAAQHRTEAFKLKGIYFWLMKKPKFASRWMKKAVAEGEKLGARPELARTFFEIGKRLMEPGSQVNSLNGFTGREYLDKAKSLFEEMGLEWDLEKLKQLERR